MTHNERDDPYRRRNSLRLPNFDYSASRVYFVTIVTGERKPVFLDRRLADAVVECLLQVRQHTGCKVYCYCLMPDHFHALVGVGDSGKSLGKICGAFKSLTTRAYWRRSGEGRLWQRQFYDHLVRNESDFFETLDYIRMNPVRKALALTPEDWAYTGQPDRL
ncbi:MAG: transposase [Acidobacteria bacterium]|nr:transposase [Acidobacteriota bacterium]